LQNAVHHGAHRERRQGEYAPEARDPELMSKLDAVAGRVLKA
jgi:hypothetical protein